MAIRIRAREALKAPCVRSVAERDPAGAFRVALRDGIDRPVHAVQKEGLAPEARRRRARGRDHGPHRPQRRLARDGRHEHAAGDGGKGGSPRWGTAGARGDTGGAPPQ